MKKKMAILATLLIAVVGTGFSVSGTYAKYVSEVNLSDDARVAKWQIGLSDATSKTLDLFHESYDYGDGNTVVKALSRDLVKDDDTADTLDNVVAPGTKGQYTFSLDGIIETNYTLKISTTGSTNGVKLTYKEDVDIDGVTTTVDKTYDPIKFYVSTSKTEDIDTIAADKLIDFDTLLTTLNGLYSGTANKVFAPGTVDATEYTIYWKWDFETGTTDAEKAANNKLDTQLGNAIAKDPQSHVIKLNIDITAEQTREAATPVVPQP